MTLTPTIVQPTSTVTPTIIVSESPSPTPTQAVTTDPGEGSVDHNSAGAAPQCGEVPPVKTGANFHIYRNGDDAIAKWIPTEGNKVHIYYKQASAKEWQYSLLDQPNNGYNDNLHSLGSMDITFALQQANDCAGGPLTEAVIDGPGDGQWTLFR